MALLWTTKNVIFRLECLSHYCCGYNTHNSSSSKKMVIIIFQYIDSLGDGYQCVFIYIYSFMSDFRSLFSISDMDWLSWSERCPGNIMFAWLGFTHELPILYVVHRYWFDKTVWIPAPPLQNTMHFKMIIWPIYHFLAN